MDATTKRKIKAMIRGILLKKLDGLEAETEYKPFFEAIFTKSQIITASVIQSFYTSFGMSVYEQIAIIIAEANGFQAKRQYVLHGEIDSQTESVISSMHQKLRNGSATGDMKKEYDTIRKSIKTGRPLKDPDSIIDLYLTKKDIEYYFGITTVKPNKEGFETHKHKLLRWIGLRLSQKNDANIVVATILPYNPYHPKPYTRFGSNTLFDRSQFLVQEKFWDFIGGVGTFQQLIEIFSEVGTELRKRLNAI